MLIDIIFVTYKSEKWLEPNIKSIINSQYDIKNKTSMYYYDNASPDNTYKKLEELKDKYAKYFKDFQIKKGNKNKGFGYGNNEAAKMGSSDYIFILNTDTELKEDTLSKNRRSY